MARTVFMMPVIRLVLLSPFRTAGNPQHLTAAVRLEKAQSLKVAWLSDAHGDFTKSSTWLTECVYPVVTVWRDKEVAAAGGQQVLCHGFSFQAFLN